MSDKNLFSTQGAIADTGGGSGWVKPMTVFLGQIVTVEHGESSKSKSPFIKIVLIDVNGEDLAQPNKQYPTAKKPVAATSEYYYSTEKGAAFSAVRLAAFRDVLGISNMDEETAKASNVQEMASILTGLLKGKKGYFINGGKEGSDGNVYGKIADSAFIYPATPEGKAAAEKQMASRGDKLIEKNTLPKDGGSSSAGSNIPAPSENFDVF